MNLWTMTSSGANRTDRTGYGEVGQDADKPPVFSPDGTKIAFASKAKIGGVASSSYNIWIMDADGSNKNYLTANTAAGKDSLDPTFSPNGLWIYFSSKADCPTTAGTLNIWKVKTDGTGLVALTTEDGTGKDSTEPRVSPDGTTVLFTSEMDVALNPSSSTNIWEMATDGTGKTALTINTAAAYDSKNAHYSTDGTEIAFASKMNVNGSAASSFNIWKMHADGSSQVALTEINAAAKDSVNPHFSPDDLKIAFESLMDVEGLSSLSNNIFVLHSDGTGTPVAVTQNALAGRDSLLAPHRIWYAE